MAPETAPSQVAGSFDVRFSHPALDVALRMLKAKQFATILDRQGIPAVTWQKTLGSDLWFMEDRSRVRACLDALLYGTVDTVGIPRVEIPAEYIASFLALCVDPVNWMSACTWYQNANTLEVLLSQDSESTLEAGVFESGMTAKRLFALTYRFAMADSAGSLSEVRSELSVRLAPRPEIADG